MKCIKIAALFFFIFHLVSLIDNYSVLIVLMFLCIWLRFTIKYILMTSNILKDFGQTIRLIRMDKELSQEELAHRCGFHRTYIGMIERGEKNITLKNIEILARSLDISICELFKDE